MNMQLKKRPGLGSRPSAVFLLVAAGLLQAWLAPEAEASKLNVPFPQSTIVNEPGGKKSETLKKLDSHLLRAQLEFKAYLARGGMPILGRFRSLNRLLKLREDRLVAVEATAAAGTQPAVAALLRLGCRKPSVYKRVISAECPIATIDRLAAEPSIKFTRAAMTLTRTGSALSQGDQALLADLARSHSGASGAGVTVGVLSDSYDCSTTALTNAAADITSGDLPNGINVLADPPQGSSECSDEGRAMLQVIHDIAPDASLAFHTTAGGQAAFANGILALQAAGATVIVDDAFNLDEPQFQEGGPISDALNQVVGQGVAYFSAAGNASRDSYEATFNPSTQFEEEFGGELHDFDPGEGVDVYQTITLPASIAGTTTPMVLQWDEPFFSISGGDGSAADYDIWICLSDALPVNSANCPDGIQGTSGNLGNDAIETILPMVSDGTEPLTVYLAISRVEGTANNLLKYVAFNDAMSIGEHATASSTLYGHANSQGALTIGAARYDQTPAFLQDPALLETFSSAGGTAIYLDSAGVRLLQPLTRQRPNVVAPDGGNTTFFGSNFDNDAFPNFSGTSAAAAHAAGVAALMLEVSAGRGLSMPSAVYAALEETAIDMGSTGFDYDSGFGLINADAAATSVSTPKLAIAATDAVKAEGSTGTAVFTFTVTRSGDLSQPSSAEYSVAGSSANPADASDFSSALTGTVSFAANETSQTITVNVMGDTVVEPDEGFTVALSNPTNATHGTAAANGTIVNDDQPPALAIAANDATKIEGNAGTTPFTFTVTRSGDLTQPSSAEYTVAGGATNPADTADFSGALTGTVSFAANEPSQIITVNAVGDTVVEPDEGFTVTLNNPTNATISTGTADGTIQNDDAALDTDADTVPDSQDNCTLVANTNQRNTDGDSYGNACDPDFNGNNIVDPADFSQIKSLIGSTTSPNQDLNGNGIVDPSDISLTKSYVGKAPGPSGLVTP